jgi:hypothetical protein
MIEGASCETCRFFDPKSPIAGSGSRADLYGTCRRRPPVCFPVDARPESPSGIRTAWPHVGKTEWCGEWEKAA